MTDYEIAAVEVPGLNSGAASMLVAERLRAEEDGLQPLAKLVSCGVGAVEPGFFGLGPVPALWHALAPEML